MNVPVSLLDADLKKRMDEYELMFWFFEKYNDYDYYKFITQPRHVLISLYNYHLAKFEINKEDGR